VLNAILAVKPFFQGCGWKLPILTDHNGRELTQRRDWTPISRAWRPFQTTPRPSEGRGRTRE